MKHQIAKEEREFQKRIEYQGDVGSLMFAVCSDYQLGDYRSHRLVPVGYEDFNLVLETDKDRFFVKVFAKFRDREACRRYIDITTHAIEAGVQHPKLFQSSKGYLYESHQNGIPIRLCVMQFIDGNSFYDLKAKPTTEEMRFLVQQAARINSIDLKPDPVYDSWAIVNFLKEYKEKRQYLRPQDIELLDPLAASFALLPIEGLPHTLVHGDIIKTNVMRDKSGKVYIIDFSVANYYPRIQELAVFLCDMAFDKEHPETFMDNYKLVLEEYQKNVPLTPFEVSSLPLYVRAAHAMHVICATYEKKAKNNDSFENQYFIDIGRAGLAFTAQLWAK